MHYKKTLATSGLIAAAAHATQTFMLDCTKSPDSCNNDCYGVFVAGFDDTLNWDKPTTDTVNARRKASGCTQSNGDSACGKAGVPPYNDIEANDSCDEYPYASTKEDVEGAVLRCVTQSDNSSEGGQLTGFYNLPVDEGGCGSEICEFTVFMKDNTYNDSPYCVNMGGKNDGKEFKLSSGKYVNARRSSEDSPVWVPHVPDPSRFIPPHERREFLLDTGERALLLSNKNRFSLYDNKTIATEQGPVKVVRELFGAEKSPHLRPIV